MIFLDNDKRGYMIIFTIVDLLLAPYLYNFRDVGKHI